MSMRAPLGRALGLGSARDGTGSFWHMRLTSIANIPLTIFFVWIVVSLVGSPYEEVVATLSSPLVAIAMTLVIVLALIHMKIGMQEIIVDYAHGGTKFVLLILNTFFSVVIGAASVFAILKIGFGG
ncbi:MAG: succinate dehydrogenase, hydrophobic membrane anchor protein [Salaquimonas sp.]|jgi:succinate dehydrogenase / fumarate reductase membrane anchor subunit|nr:succinate dehydrogenase, hydrophobic membrane anchor protein [Salaquimonas sp.]